MRRPSRRVRISVLLALNLAFVAMLLRSPGDLGLPQRYGDAGTVDFIEYWTAHALMVKGENPYDPALLLAAQRPLGMTGSIPVLMVNPPWIVTLLAPVLSFPFFTAASIWIGLSLLFAALAGAATTIAYRGRLLVSPATLVATFAFQPIASSLAFGQLGLLHALSIAGFLCAASRGRELVAGLMLVPLTVKPHLTYLVWVLLAYWVVRQRAWRLVTSFVAGLSGLIAITWLLYPSSTRQWIDSTAHRPPLQYVVASLVGVVRELTFALTGVAARWPLVVIPGVTALCFAAWLAWRRPAIDLRLWLPPVLALSLFTSPYGWVFDQCQLVVIQVGLVALAGRKAVTQRARRRIWLALGAVQLAIVVTYAAGFREMQDLFWTGLAMGAVWLYGLRELNAVGAQNPGGSGDSPTI